MSKGIGVMFKELSTYTYTADLPAQDNFLLSVSIAGLQDERNIRYTTLMFSRPFGLSMQR